MRNIYITYAIIIALAITTLVSGVHTFANIAGFIAAMGFMIIFFADRDPEKEMTKEQLETAHKMRKYWYTVFATGLFFSFLLGSFWNDKMGSMS